MNCVICGSPATKITESRPARYRTETVAVPTEFYRCGSCNEEFVTPEQMREHVRAVKNEIRKKYGLLSPEAVVEIRKKLKLTQEELEDLLGTGPKVVVRWESGKVIQSSGHDNMLRLLGSGNPDLVEKLRQIQKYRSAEEEKYRRTHQSQREGMVPQAV
jgi:putative zinc finger/helix-turn-helix YgiT family protein